MMEYLIKDITEEAARMGACHLTDGVSDLSSLVSLFFSPQGREFCTGKGFPSIETFQRLKEVGVGRHNVFVDGGEMDVTSTEHMAFVGDTKAAVRCHGVEHPFTVIVAHGAEVTIEADNYAVVRVETIGRCAFKVVNKDNTAVVL